MENEKIKRTNSEKILENQTWKISNKKYLFELQKFLDVSDNIQDKEIRKIVISQMLKCDKILTARAEEIFREMLDENA